MRHHIPGGLTDNSKVPMEGRLHNPGLYSPTVSEFLVGPFLRCLGGELVWQPEHDGPGSDYRVPWLERWLTYPWARVIDLVVFFDYRPRDGQWGLIADSFSLSRTHRALRILTSALPQCEHGHFHVPACPPGKCDQPFGF